MSHVELKNIKKAYGSHEALKDVTLSIARGAFFTLLGPSGCGKTTLLRAIAGFHQQDAGDILLEGQSISHLGANKRNVGMVFQDYALFPHLSVFDNVAFGLVQQKVAAAEVRERVNAILVTVHLDELAERMPHQLSGGQQQRVGLARALVIRPKVLLMDEPLSNLDAKLRVDLRRDIRSLQQTLDITTVYVTHDQEEALSVSDQVCVMHDGVVQQVGSPWVIYNRPANRFVATFVGSNNFLALEPDGAGEPLVLGKLLDVPKSVREQASSGVVASIRPEKILVNRPLSVPGVEIEGSVRQAMFTGRELQLTLEVAGHGLLDALTEPNPTMIALKPGDAVQLGIKAEDLLFFAPGPVGMLLQ
ncbi:MAG: ABC transporter ATP-binding protein [Propionivibrio sp.]